MRSGRESYSVALYRIIKDFAKLPAKVFLLVEGKDADYYRPRASMILADLDLSFRNLKGKQNIKELINALLNNLSLKNLRFAVFYDRAYEADIAEITRSFAYVTDSYYIENYYIGSEAVGSAIASLLYDDAVHSDELDNIIFGLSDNYCKLQTNFHSCVRLFNEWAWVQRHMPRPGKISLDKFDVGKMLTIDKMTWIVTSNYKLDDLNALAPERKPVTPSEIAIASEWFSHKSWTDSFRGKQEIDMLFLYLTEVIKLANDGASPFSKKTKVGKRLSRQEIISELSAYAKSPQSLIDFLHKLKSDWGDTVIVA
ncbi:DUF4435 domain-containing protein [Sphingomonas sp. BT553]|uniref:DUF4435 domain-containing protein n=1 Tax=Sphingomonas mollis TaxID=2795726 RepID=A0ABS0XNR0_9SPHN|nr:DUF4435 domain-containing protein [Sphingomonas sp. BT553]